MRRRRRMRMRMLSFLFFSFLFFSFFAFFAFAGLPLCVPMCVCVWRRLSSVLWINIKAFWLLIAESIKNSIVFRTHTHTHWDSHTRMHAQSIDKHKRNCFMWGSARRMNACEYYSYAQRAKTIWLAAVKLKRTHTHPHTRRHTCTHSHAHDMSLRLSRAKALAARLIQVHARPKGGIKVEQIWLNSGQSVCLPLLAPPPACLQRIVNTRVKCIILIVQ